MHLQNPMVYTQFHPVAYMVKLNIEMTMASLIKRIAQATISERDARSMGRYTYEYAGNDITHPAPILKSGNYATASVKIRKISSTPSTEQDPDRIRTTKEVQVKIENVPSTDGDKKSAANTSLYNELDRRPHEYMGVTNRQSDDELLAP